MRFVETLVWGFTLCWLKVAWQRRRKGAGCGREGSHDWSRSVLPCGTDQGIIWLQLWGRSSSLLQFSMFSWHPVEVFKNINKKKKKGNKRVLALISAYVTASHRAEARSLRKLSLHCPCCWVTVSAPHMTPNDNYKLHLKMLNGAGIAGRWRCCLCLSMWALEQGSLQTHLTPNQSFHGIWT